MNSLPKVPMWAEMSQLSLSQEFCRINSSSLAKPSALMARCWEFSSTTWDTWSCLAPPPPRPLLKIQIYGLPLLWDLLNLPSRYGAKPLKSVHVLQGFCIQPPLAKKKRVSKDCRVEEPLRGLANWCLLMKSDPCLSCTGFTLEVRKQCGASAKKEVCVCVWLLQWLSSAAMEWKLS